MDYIYIISSTSQIEYYKCLICNSVLIFYTSPMKQMVIPLFF